MRPYLRHIVTLITLELLLAPILGIVFFVGSDVISNKILVGEKLQPLQATVLMLDESYVRETDDDETKLTPEQRRDVRNALLFPVIALIILGLVLLATIPYYDSWVWQSVNQSLRLAIYDRIEKLSLKYHNHGKVGDAIFRIFQDSASITHIVEFVREMAMQFVSLGATVIVVLFFDWRLAFVVLVLYAATIYIAKRMMPMVRRYAAENRAKNSAFTSQLQRTFSAHRIIKSHLAENHVIERFDTMSQDALDAAFNVRKAMVFLSLYVMLVGALAIIAAEYVMADWTVTKQATFLGGLLTVILSYKLWNLGAFQNANGSFSESLGISWYFVRMVSMMQDLMIGIRRAFFLFDLETDIEDAADPTAFPAEVHSVTWENVHFAYETDQPVLRGIDLQVQAGTLIAIVGATGTGKSTLLTTLLRLFDPQQGAIKINDEDIRGFEISELRRHVAIALQRNVLFSASVKENIRYSATAKTDADVKEAARIACADEFIRELENGYDTELGGRAVKLSTGQRQRLSIARAVVRDTPILILDEPTSALDNETETRLMENLHEWGKEKVVFLISHRISSFQNADLIAYLEDGVIQEFGTHDELLARPNGLYANYVATETL